MSFLVVLMTLLASPHTIQIIPMPPDNWIIYFTDQTRQMRLPVKSNDSISSLMSYVQGCFEFSETVSFCTLSGQHLDDPNQTAEAVGLKDRDVLLVLQVVTGG
jgi:hypothetical protein